MAAELLKSLTILKFADLLTARNVAVPLPITLAASSAHRKQCADGLSLVFEFHAMSFRFARPRPLLLVDAGGVSARHAVAWCQVVHQPRHYRL